MLNDLQIEAAARKLCELRGIDPDATITMCIDHRRGIVNLNADLQVATWENIAPDIRYADQVREAIASVEAESFDCDRCGHSAGHHAWPDDTPAQCEVYPCDCPKFERIVLARVAESPLGPCKCGHSYDSHVFVGEKNGYHVLSCSHCRCFDYVSA